jgi:hypothetical protein
MSASLRRSPLCKPGGETTDDSRNPSITTTTAPTSRWIAIVPDAAIGPLAYPCCASNWFGVASPVLPSPGGTLVDGNYAIEFAWPSDFAQPVIATANRADRHRS